MKTLEERALAALDSADIAEDHVEDIGGTPWRVLLHLGSAVVYALLAIAQAIRPQRQV